MSNTVRVQPDCIRFTGMSGRCSNSVPQLFFVLLSMNIKKNIKIPWSSLMHHQTLYINVCSRSSDGLWTPQEASGTNFWKKYPVEPRGLWPIHPRVCRLRYLQLHEAFPSSSSWTWKLQDEFRIGMGERKTWQKKNCFTSSFSNFTIFLNRSWETDDQSHQLHLSRVLFLLLICIKQNKYKDKAKK